LSLRNTLLLAFGLVLIAIAPGTASADTIRFTLVSSSHTIQLDLPSNPTPDFVGPYFFTLDDVPFTLDGSSQLARIVNFFDDSGGGGIGICDYVNCPLVDLFGPQLFGGSLEQPVLMTGMYYLTDAGDGILPGDFQTFQSVTPVPEPGSITLLLCGTLGFIARVRPTSAKRRQMLGI